MSTTSEDLIVRYLMGELPPSERGDVERRFFAEPGFLDRVRAIEEQLICDALSGTLEPYRQARFHDDFLSFPDLRQKYEATKALQSSLSAAHVVSTPGPAPVIDRSGHAAKRTRNYYKLLAIAAGMSWIFLALDDARLHLTGNSATLSTVIQPGQTRSRTSQQIRLIVPPRTSLVRIILKIEISDQHKSFQAVLNQVDSGQEDLRISGLVAKRAGAFQDVVVELPASILNDNSYVLTLNGILSSGVEPVETYSFQVLRDSGEPSLRLQP